MAWFRKREPAPETRGVALSDGPAMLQLLGVADDADGAFMNDTKALSLSAVFRSVSLISGAVASLPLRVWETDRDGIRHEVRSWLDNPTGPDGMTQTEWLETIAVSLLLHGNAYLIKVENQRGIAGLFPVYPGAVQVEWDPSYPDGRKYTVSLADGTPQVYDCRRLVHIMGPSLDGLKGLSVVQQARRSMSTGIEGDRHAYRSFVTGASIAGLATPGNDEDITGEEARAIKDDFNRAVSGAGNAGSIAVINRRLNFTPWQMSAADAQFLESREFSVDEIGRWFGVPPHLLGLNVQSSWGTGIAEQNRGLARYTLGPWLTRIDARLSRLFPASKNVEFDLSEFVKPSPEEETEMVLKLMTQGLITPNEARQRLNYPPLPDGDEIRLPPGSLTPEQMKGGTSDAPNPGGTEEDVSSEPDD